MLLRSSAIGRASLLRGPEGASLLNPATLSWTVLLQGTPTLPWVGSASAGASLGKDLTGVNGAAIVSGALDLDGTNDHGTLNINAEAALSAAAYEVWAVVRVDAVDTNGNDFVNAAIVATKDSNRFALCLRSPGVGTFKVNLRTFNGTNEADSTLQATIPGTGFHVVHAYYGSNTQGLGVDGIYETPATGVTNVSLSTGLQMLVGRTEMASTADHYMDGAIKFLGITNTNFTAGQRSALLASLQATYGL